MARNWKKTSKEEEDKKMEENKQPIAYEPVNIFDLQDEETLVIAKFGIEEIRAMLYMTQYLKHNKVNYIVLKFTNRGILLSSVKSMNGLNSLRILFSNVYIINKTSSNEMNKILNKCLFKADCLK